MSEIEVLVATTGQKDLSKYRAMNLQSDVFFANQDGRIEYIEEQIGGHVARMLTTGLTGVSQNRNIALLHATGDICLLADDDFVYRDGYKDAVLRAYKQLPDAEIVIFNAINITGNREQPKSIGRVKRLRFYDVKSYSTCQISFKRNSVMRSGVWFHGQIGPGRTYKAGEDSLFFREARRRGLRAYLYPYTLAEVSSETSTWFSGFNAEYFYNKGAWLSAAVPTFKVLVAFYFSLKFWKKSSLSPVETFRLMRNGMKGFKKSISYDEWRLHLVQSEHQLRRDNIPPSSYS